LTQGAADGRHRNCDKDSPKANGGRSKHVCLKTELQQTENNENKKSTVCSSGKIKDKSLQQKKKI
jgi:hypothetical protein